MKNLKKFENFESQSNVDELKKKIDKMSHYELCSNMEIW